MLGLATTLPAPSQFLSLDLAELLERDTYDYLSVYRLLLLHNKN